MVEKAAFQPQNTGEAGGIRTGCGGGGGVVSHFHLECFLS